MTEFTRRTYRVAYKTAVKQRDYLERVYEAHQLCRIHHDPHGKWMRYVQQRNLAYLIRARGVLEGKL